MSLKTLMQIDKSNKNAAADLSLQFAPALVRLKESLPNPLGRKVLWTLLALLCGLLVWGLVGKLDIVAVADGKLVPQSYLKIVQPSEAGIIKEILVREGQSVSAGQVLMRMDSLITDADAKSSLAELARKRMALRRIDAELANRRFEMQASDAPELAREALSQYRANRAAFEAALAEENSRLVKAQQELAAAEQVKTKLEETLPHYRNQDKAFEKLSRDGYVGSLMGADKKRERVEKEQDLNTQIHLIGSARASIQQSEKKLAQLDADYRRQLHAERQDAQNAVDKLSQEVAKLEHRQSLLELRATQNSVVKDLATHSIGTVVQPGTVMLTLVPTEGVLNAEVWVSNEDVGFIRPGQTVKLKFAAFPFQKYGMAEGTVEHVSADAADGDPALANQRPGATGGARQPLVYKALVSLKSMNLQMDGATFPLGAGMQASAEILLGTRTVMEYLLSPVRKAWHEAGRER